MSIAERVKQIRERIEAAAVKSGRTANDITIVGVTKGVSVEAVVEARAAGISILGENRVQEAEEKVLQVPGEWHLIGHLQSNKVHRALELFSTVQSVDSVRLAEKINESALALGKIVPIFLEINISGEEQKYGFKPEDIYGAGDGIAPLSNIQVTGLMGIAPNSPDTQERRASFKKLKNIFGVCKSMKIENFQMKFLSMGMSDDFETAIEEGSNMLRLGRSIFGERKK